MTPKLCDDCGSDRDVITHWVEYDAMVDGPGCGVVEGVNRCAKCDGEEECGDEEVAT